MTVPEEKRPGTGSADEADDTGGRGTDTPPRPAGGTGRTLREALEEARVRPDDFADR
ncbi:MULTISPECIES: hypothetical protein [unclassified Streptomyces]|uniref:hypothetical protein n=1 Tax=unclassified Streptomyces TaxID=2593676 RepID=UPI0019296F4C|nr:MULTISPECIES: hypothetical protein [unclassified Streptomyces]MCW5249719.1 hypothetical protein [Streptomyces sp. SHP 1-2]